ncbi:MAG: hypothetical protein V2I46_12965 [Bacteroides sp.]|jgi:hypothetical protein|nr:hypothetical protein [Bacteroides sp.]
MSDFDEYKKRMIVGIEDWQADLERLKSQVEKTDPEKQKAQLGIISKLEEEIKKAKSSFGEFEQSGTEALEEIKKGLDNAWEDISRAFQEAKSKF